MLPLIDDEHIRLAENLGHEGIRHLRTKPLEVRLVVAGTNTTKSDLQPRIMIGKIIVKR